MAAAKGIQPKNKPPYPYPSKYGSHKMMVNDEKTAQLNKEGRVICTDEYGDYETSISKLDDKLADVRRYEWREGKTL